MADEEPREQRQRFSSDRNRDGMDDDIDRRHGNERESASYSRIYDPRSEQEYSNLMEPQNELQKRNAERRLLARKGKEKELLQAAQQDVHFFPDVGKFIIPAENTWAAHAEMVLNNDMRLHFNPDKYFFDKIIADQIKLPALTDRNHPDFEKYRGLRTNLEVLRNDIIGQYLDDGGFDKGDEVFIAPLKGIATVLGQALANDVWWKRPFVNYFSRDVANVEAVGAAEMYKFLLSQQEKSTTPSFFTNIMEGIRDFFGMPTKRWGILELERTPFSPVALSAPPPNLGRILETPPAVDLSKQEAEHLALESLSLITIANNQFKQVDTLSAEDKAISVEDGRTILRWLRNLQGMDMDVQDFLSAGTPPERVAKAEALSTLVKLYTHQMQRSPAMHTLPEVKDGSDAAGGVAMMIAEHAMTQLSEKDPAYALLASAVDTMPETHFERSSQSVGQLIDHMEIGLARLTGAPIGERSAVDRLLEASERAHQHAKQLHSIETLSEPKREESVELGREILRKLRNLLFADKPIEDMLDTGKPEEKATLAEKVAEMVEIYRNLVAKAVTANPGLATDARIKAANDAVGGLTHGIKLMAAKEIPNSMAQTQQIGADVTQDPNEWKHLSNRAASRLLDTMEGGLEAALANMEQQDQAAQRDEDIAQEAIEAAMHSGNARRKRRQRRTQKSGVGGKKQEKVNRDIMADDLAANQGRYREQRKTENQAPPYVGLNAKDLAAIKSLGSALRGANQAAKDLPVADISLSSPVSPDDKSTAEKVIEQIRQSRRNNTTRNT